jgi:protein-tyrosine phosphatase
LNVVAEAKETSAATLQSLITKPLEANKILGDGKATALFVTIYRDFISLPSARQSYRQLFDEFGNSSDVPALFHCTTGKDRTGWAAAALLTLLGLPKEQVYQDYMRSND